MSLSIGIVGLPNVGKSTLFNALTNNKVLAANYPFATIEPNTGIVAVPDPRLDKLAQLVKPDKVMPATVTFMDIAGLVAGAHKGEGLGNKFLAHIRESSAIAQVVRVFNDPNVQHVSNKLEPKNDIETINAELILADIATVDARLAKITSEAKANPKLIPAKQLLEQTHNQLDQGKLAGSFLSKQEQEQLSDLHLLSAKPFIVVFNLDEDQLANHKLHKELEQIVHPCPSVFLCAKVEAELADMDKQESKELLKELGQKESGLEQLIHSGFKALGLISYLTAGPKEVRAWTIHQGDKAPQAAGVIHGDFERGFIAAEVVSYEKFVSGGGWQEARAKGWVRTEGKDYTMQDGDIVEFRFNV